MLRKRPTWCSCRGAGTVGASNGDPFVCREGPHHSQDTSSEAIAAYEAEMFARMRHMTEDTMVNTEMLYAPDASDRVVALFRSFGAAEAVPPAAEA